MDSLVLGDNQFFGVNHHSLSSGGESQVKFSDSKAIVALLNEAQKAGIGTFMFTTHERLLDILKNSRRLDLNEGMKYIPCIPYAHKYANSVAERGMVSTLTSILAGSFLSVLTSSAAVVSSEYEKLIKLLVDVELAPLKRYSFEYIFLQNVVTDLVIGLRLYDFLLEYYLHIKKKYGATAGFITMNYAATYDVVVNRLGLEDVSICSPINQKGFRMNPSKAVIEAQLATSKVHSVAMSIYASGAIDPATAWSYINTTPGIDAVLFGASSLKNILGTMGGIRLMGGD